MSEYQYYEFLTLDRPLTAAEQKAVNSLSSHIDVSATQASVTYNYGSFKHDPKTVLAKYFDAMLYITNWGTRQLMFRFPKNMIQLQDLQAYALNDGIKLQTIGDYVVLDMEFNSEDGEWEDGWMEGEGTLSGLASLRRDILRGDYRALYLVWLKTAHYWSDAAYEDENGEDEYEGEGDGEEAIASEVEPPVPPNLSEPYVALTNLMAFFGIDPDLVASAASASPRVAAVDENLAEKIPLLPEDERNTFLTRLLNGEAHLDVALAARLRALSGGKSATLATETPKRRTLQEIIAPMKEYQQRRIAEEKQRAEAERKKHLETVAKQENLLWSRLPGLIDRRQGNTYDEAVEILVDLRALAFERDQVDAFIQRLKTLLMPYASLRGLHERIKRNRLMDR